MVQIGVAELEDIHHLNNHSWLYLHQFSKVYHLRCLRCHRNRGEAEIQVENYNGHKGLQFLIAFQW